MESLREYNGHLKEAAWAKDNEVAKCKQCDREFTISRRKVSCQQTSCEFNFLFFKYSTIVAIVVKSFAIIVLITKCLYHQAKSRFVYATTVMLFYWNDTHVHHETNLLKSYHNVKKFIPLLMTIIIFDNYIFLFIICVC